MTTTTSHDGENSGAARAAQAPKRELLKDSDIRHARPGAEPFRLSDGGGLYLIVWPSGRRVWRTNYITNGVKHLHTLGEYPAMTIKQARDARAALRFKVRDGANPNQERTIARKGRVERNSQTFRLMATEWHTVMARTVWLPVYAKEVMRRFERYAFPAIGDVPIADVRRDDIITLLEHRQLASRAAANLLRINLQSAFESWVDRELIGRNPAARLAKRFAVIESGSRPAALTIEDARAVLAGIEDSSASLSVRLLNRFQALTCVRPGEARKAEWSEFDGSGIWKIPAERMKGPRGRKKPHDVPLSRQAQEVLDVAREVLGQGSPFVFPATHRGRFAPVGETTIGKLMKRNLPAALRHVPHGWRATFETIMNERHPREDRILDQMLAHNRKGNTAARYNRATYTAEARVWIQEWADLLLAEAPSAWTLAGLKSADVLAFPKPAASLEDAA